jgi:hypothetical protein
MNEIVRPLFAVALLVLLAACSMDAVEQDWDEWVANHNACDTVDDCVLVYPGCPLGCFDAVHVDDEDEAYRIADDLIARWSMGTNSCVYDCIGATAACNGGVCEAIPDEQ